MMQMTYDLAMAAAADAANRSMRASGRTAWNEDDYHAAVAMFERLWPDGSDVTPPAPKRRRTPRASRAAVA